MDSPASDTPRPSILSFLARPSRPRTQAAHGHTSAPSQILSPPPSQPQSQPQAQTQPQLQPQLQSSAQRQGNPSIEQQHQGQQPSPTNQQPSPLSATISQFLPQSPIPTRRQTLATPAPIPPSININTNTSTQAPTLASPSSMQTGTFGNMLRRRRSANNVERSEANRRAQDHNNAGNNGGSAGANVANNTSANGGGGSTGPTHRIRLVPLLESVRSLTFDPISRDVRQGDQPLRIGRFTDHSSTPGQLSNKLAFKSKVVSRGHAEVWFEHGSFFIKDTKSSSGTFLNNIRLSPPNAESRAFPIKDGDVLQLGVDYQGGTEEMYRCVKIRIELGREWQTTVNAYNLQALQQLRSLANTSATQGQGRTTPSAKPARPAVTANTKTIRLKAPSKLASSAISASAPPSTSVTSNAVSDCCICLSSVTICQALFIAPCSHAYHYKCIRPLLQMHHPGFSCPLCRTFANLEADVEGGEFLIGAGGGIGLADDMVVDEEEIYDDNVVVVEEGYDGADNEEGGVGGQGLPNQGSGVQVRTQSRSGRLSTTPEAGAEAEAEAEAEADGEGDAGSQTDTPPDSMGPSGMGGFAVIGAGGIITPSVSAPHAHAQAQTPARSQLHGGQGLIHDPAVDVDPSASRSSSQPVSGLGRLPLREDDADLGLIANITFAGYESDSSVIANIRTRGDLLGGGVGGGGGGGSSHHDGSQAVSIATLVNKRR